MKTSAASDALGQFLIALAGTDAHALAKAADEMRRWPDGFGGDLQQMVAIAPKLWFQARTAEAMKMTSSVAWRLALTAIEEGLERHLEEMHRTEEALQARRG